MSIETTDLQTRLESIKEEHRRRYLSEELNKLAATMEETILQRVLAKAFFEEDVEVDHEVKAEVQEVLELLDHERYDAVEDQLEEVRRDVTNAETTVQNRIQELRLNHNSTVTAMRRLNERVERVNPTRLEMLEGLLDDWRWKEHVYTDDDADLETLKENARSFGEDMHTAFNELKDELFGAYPDEIRTLIYRMIEDERLSYADLTPDQRRLLADSDIGEYIELTLS
ncbi:hypothetical protein SAMN06266787_10824 [Halorubrum ezzemoulense]|uniref:Uncharacterized protein n=1 Tax=Halorubrum ezzemoulense TaxID=337243 RepID=A0A238Y314_HALEZ|nr:hypothetical protein [Halorubrum ezzemoulense]SNR65410.1 hypothetical protein SAMN06266787_10824 [Halorubrum ezzemoulense]